jgi:hypothetical protein
MARKSGIFAGIIMLFITFIYKIPTFFIENVQIHFTIFSNANIDYCLWGYASTNTGFTSIIISYPESYVALLVFLIALFIGIISIMASTTKAKILHSLILYRLNMILILLLLFLFGLIAIFLNLNNIVAVFFPFFEVLGLGYYLLILVLILNIVAMKKLKKLIKE